MNNGELTIECKSKKWRRKKYGILNWNDRWELNILRTTLCVQWTILNTIQCPNWTPQYYANEKYTLEFFNQPLSKYKMKLKVSCITYEINWEIYFHKKRTKNKWINSNVVRIDSVWDSKEIRMEKSVQNANMLKSH